MSRSVNRALSILNLYNNKKKEWGISEIARELQLSKSTVHNLVKAMEQVEYLTQNQHGKYCLGMRLFELGRAYSEGNELHAASSPMVELLTKKYKQTVHVAIYAGRRAVFIINNKSERETGHNIFTRTGDIPAYCTAVGKVLISWQAPEYIEHYLRTESRVPFTTHTIIDKDVLRKEFNQIRIQGYGVDQQEAVMGIGCIAAPIFGPCDQIIAAISVSGNEQRLLDPLIFPECCSDVIDAAKRISASMGYHA